MIKGLKSWIIKQKKLVIVLAIAGGSLISLGFVEDYYFEVSKNLDIFTTVFRDINVYYVDSLQPGDLMKKGIDAMLRTLDPYTVFISAKRTNSLYSASVNLKSLEPAILKCSRKYLLA